MSNENPHFGAPPQVGPLGQVSPRPAFEKRLWAVGGGKGGIGKTLLTSNMAVFLGKMNKQIVVVDLDLGAANLHTSFGLNDPKYTLSDVVLGKIDDIHAIVQSTSNPNVGIISGARNNIGMSNIRYMHKRRLIRKFRDINADVILLDLGAGTNFNTLDFFLLAHQKIVVMTPEPTSIENGYRFIKAAFYRLLKSSTQSPYVKEIIESAMDAENEHAVRTPKELIQRIKQMSPIDGISLEQNLQHFQMALILNQIRTKEEANVGDSIKYICKQYFGLHLDYAGFLPHDQVVWQSVRKRVPFIQEFPHSVAVQHFSSLMNRLIKLDAHS